MRKLCVSGDTELVLSNGEIVKIEDFVSTFCQSAGSYDIAGDYRTVSFDNGHQVNNKILKAQKFPSPAGLIKLKTASGIELKLTKDHEVLVSAVNGPKWVRAENLQEGDLVFSPAELSIEENSPYIVDLLDHEFLVNGEGVRQKCILGFKEKYGSIRGMARKLGIDRKPFYGNSGIYIRIKYIKAACDWNKIKDKITKAKSERGRIVELTSKRLTKKIMYLLGLIASDGCVVSERRCVRPSRIKFDNSEKELIRKFVNVHKQLFPSVPLHVKNVRSNLSEVDVNNPVLAGIAHSLGIKSPAKEADFKHVITLPKRLIKSFLKGYFDGDGAAYFHQKEKRCLTNINFYTINRVTAKRLCLLLKRVGIRSKIYSRKVNGSFKTKNERYNIVRLKSPCDKLKFIEEIGSNHPKKKETLQKMKRALKKSKAKNLEYSPLHVKEIIKKTLRENNLWIHNLNLGGNFWRVLNSDIPMTKYLLSRVVKKLERVVEEKALQPITSILNSAFCVERIKEVQEIKSTEAYVYDITVENSHNFIPEGSIVVSNCHDVGLALGCGAHMRELRRTRSGALTENDAVTLHDIAYHQAKYQETQDETYIRRIIHPIETALKHTPKIIIRDSAVSAVCHGAKLTVPGILALETGIRPKQTVVMFTQKGEAVALAKALVPSDILLEVDHGFAAKTKCVLMPRNIYPKMWQTGGLA
ncbi:MAG: LAGLIDADG family homing endonuclease [Thermoproteota archaeon]|nr:LAGLIDADG family homing endonuclease [Thermoproteota archaeon]